MLAMPKTPAGASPPDPGDPANYQAGCNRKVQLTTRANRRFDPAKRKRFLEWFAATSNAKLAARQADVGYSTVYYTRMHDPSFAEAWDQALEQGYARLEAKLLEMQFEAIDKEIEFDPGFEPGDEFPEQQLTDPTTALALLRQHRGNTAKGRAAGFASNRVASDEEVRHALAKRLKAFGVRVTKEDMRGDD